MRSLIPDHQIWECRINLIHQQIFLGILDHRIPKKNFVQKIRPKFYNTDFTVPKFPDLQYVCMYVCMYVCVCALHGRGYVCPIYKMVCMCVHVSYVEGCMYMCMYILHGGCLCVCTHTYIPFRYNPQVGYTHNAYPAPGRMDTHTFQNTHTFSTHSPCRMNAHIYIPPSRQDTHYPLRTHLLRRANTIVSRK